MEKDTDSKNSPPRWADKLLERFCSPDLLEEILGDMHERYGFRSQKWSLSKARRYYWKESLAYLRPSFFKKHVTMRKTRIGAMLQNSILVSFRKIGRNRAFTAINVSGLTLGIASFLMIFLWIADEKSIDNFHAKGDQLFNIYETEYSNGKVEGSYATMVKNTNDVFRVTLSDIQEAIPEVEAVNYYATGYRLPWGHPETFRVGNKVHKLEGARASKDFFKMFNYPMLVGDPETALSEIKDIAISEKMAKLFFGSSEGAIGKSLQYENRFDFLVSAVFEDLTSQSSLRFDFLINWEAQMKQISNWDSNVIVTTLRLAQNANVLQVEKQINELLEGRNTEQEGHKIELGLQPYRDQYLISTFENGKPAGGRIEYIKIFTLVAIFILVVACINFMNLSTARSLKQTKEVGIRKVIGSSRGSLIAQYLIEATLLSFFALLLSLMLIYALLPGFNYFTGKTISIPLNDFSYWARLIGLALLTGLLAGGYPALFLSSLKPMVVLKGTMRFSRSAVWFRKGLVVFQFGLSILLLIGSLVVSRQTEYVQTVDLGYDKENLLYVQIEGDLNEKYAIFKQELSKMPSISMVDRSSEAPHTMSFAMADPFDWEGKEEGTSVYFKPTSVGYDFLKIMDLEVVNGRDFSKDFATDSTAFLINETALREIGMEEPLGKWISAWGKKGHIVGIIKDYHTHSLHEPIQPLIVDVKEDLYFGVILVRTEAGKTKEAIESLELVHKDLNPDYPLDFQFIDEEYGRLYQTEQVITNLSNVFAGLAIVISCLGLLGLAMFSAEQRIKEIGIRKVLGASVQSIIALLSQDFLKLVSISFLIAAPLAWLIMDSWLQAFAYKIDLAWWIFGLTGLLSLLIAFLTVSFEAAKAALANPAKCLRSE